MITLDGDDSAGGDVRDNVNNFIDGKAEAGYSIAVCGVPKRI